MPYCTQADIEKVMDPEKVAQLSDDNNDGVADATVIAEAIDWADRQIDSYAAGKYALPFAPSTPPEIADRSAELAAFWLYRRKQNRDETVQRMYGDAIAWLKDLQRGVVNVTAAIATTQVGAGVGAVKTSVKETVITDEKLERF